jgi:hypothetical protein
VLLFCGTRDVRHGATMWCMVNVELAQKPNPTTGSCNGTGTVRMEDDTYYGYYGR